MAKVGRNEPCPCGSGKKYKQCCLARDEELKQASALKSAEDHAASRNHLNFCDDCYDALVEASNAVLDLIEADALDEAEEAANDLLERFPDAFDGYARLGLIYETRGDAAKAVEYYQMVVDMVEESPEFHEPWVKRDFRAMIARLEAEVSAG